MYGRMVDMLTFFLRLRHSMQATSMETLFEVRSEELEPSWSAPESAEPADVAATGARLDMATRAMDIQALPDQGTAEGKTNPARGRGVSR